MSGGVIIAATNIITMKECFLNRASIEESMNPIFVKAKAMTGSWNTKPMINVRVMNVVIYESRVIVLWTRSATLYVPKNRKDIGNKM